MPDQNSCPTLRSLLCKLHKIIYRYFTPSHIEPLDRFEIYNYNKIVDNRHQSVSVQALKRCVVPVCGTRGALSWLYGSQKLVTKTFNGSFTSVGEPFSLLSTDWRSNMIEDSILKCLTSFSKLLDTRYIMHLGRAGKTVSFEIGFTKHDCYHLMGLHYLKDRRDNRGRNYIFDELLASADARKHIATSTFFDDNVRDRILFTGMLETLLDDNNTIFHYNPKRLQFFSRIKAEYLLDNTAHNREVFIFLDNRKDSNERFCRSIFPKTSRDYAFGQARWTLLYKKKLLSDGTETILYHHKGYCPQRQSDN